MPFYQTLDPVPSADMRNLFDNTQNLDIALNDITSAIWIDRLGRNRMSWFGMESAFSLKIDDFEERFNGEIISQKSLFEYQLQSQESRFNTFIEHSRYYVVGDYEDGPLTITEYNQLVRYQNELWKITADTDIPFTTAGNTAESWDASDKEHFVSVGDGALRQNLGSDDGLKLIGRCPSVSVLRGIEPERDGQIIWLDSYDTGTGVGGGYLKYDADISVSDYPDDGVINFVTAGGRVWRRILQNGTAVREIPMEWGGVISTYVTEQSARVQAVFNAALKLATNNSITADTRRVAVIPVPKLLCNKTVYFNVTFVKITGNSSEWAFSSSGNYDEHPTAVGVDGVTRQKMCLVARGDRAENTWSIAAYRDRQDITELSLYLSTGISADDGVQTTKSDTAIIGLSYYSDVDTLREAQFTIDNVSFVGFGKGFCNGNYGWGGEFNNCKWSDCYYSTWLISGSDNGERFSFNFCVMQNNHNGIYNYNWAGHITVFGGSYVWNTGEYFHIGKSRGATIRPNHVEYVNSKSSIITTDEWSTDGGAYYGFPVVTWEGGTCVISANYTTPTTDVINLCNPAKRSTILVRDVSFVWNSIDVQPNMRLAPDSLPWYEFAGRVLIENLSMQVGTWGALARSRGLLNASMLSVCGATAGSNVSAGGGTVSFVKNTSENHVVFTAAVANSSPKYLYIDVPLERFTDWWACVPVMYLKDVSLSGECSVQFIAFNKTQGVSNGQTVLGTAAIKSGDTVVSPLNQYNRPVQYLRTQLSSPAVVDTVRVAITFASWNAGDTAKFIAGGIVTI